MTAISKRGNEKLVDLYAERNPLLYSVCEIYANYVWENYNQILQMAELSSATNN